MFKLIPTLTGKAALRFVRNAEKPSKNESQSISQNRLKQ